MAEPLKITMGELRTIIARRFSAMADRVSPTPGSLGEQFQEPLSFLRTNLFNDVNSVLDLIDQLRMAGEPEAVVTSEPKMTPEELRAFLDKFRLPPVDRETLFTDAENAAAVQEVFTERGV